ncbi:MAG: coenzyme F420-0:L-glutamate ligase [Candidatus Peribacteraceae bacterium]|nr:coenzyme F420-0:L-glutamate ligase [Candidatus Peribacteraceae bacterium]
MQLLPIRTRLIEPGDDLARILADAGALEDGDIVAISSKAAAMAEGTLVALQGMEVSTQAQAWSDRLQRGHADDAAFRQAILEETERMHGHAIGDCPLAMLTDLKPDGLTEGSILAANAGLDRSNVQDGYAIGWPHDPVETVRQLRRQLQEYSGKKVAVLLTDSCCRPRRIGVTAIALTVSGFDPIKDEIGKRDLFGKPLTMTQEAVADQFATAANFLMGNADESVPAAVLRDHGVPFTSYEGWVPGIEPEEDLFRGAI